MSVVQDQKQQASQGCVLFCGSRFFFSTPMGAQGPQKIHVVYSSSMEEVCGVVPPITGQSKGVSVQFPENFKSGREE